MEANIAPHAPAVSAAIEHLSKRPDADPERLGLVGFSLGGGIAMSYINASPAGTVDVFADFYGYVAPLLGAGVANFPPTIIFHNKNDLTVRPARLQLGAPRRSARQNDAADPTRIPRIR